VPPLIALRAQQESIVVLQVSLRPLVFVMLATFAHNLHTPISHPQHLKVVISANKVTIAPRDPVSSFSAHLARLVPTLV
jgi:hypothetical protein